MVALNAELAHGARTALALAASTWRDGPAATHERTTPRHCCTGLVGRKHVKRAWRRAMLHRASTPRRRGRASARGAMARSCAPVAHTCSPPLAPATVVDSNRPWCDTVLLPPCLPLFSLSEERKAGSQTLAARPLQVLQRDAALHSGRSILHLLGALRPCPLELKHLAGSLAGNAVISVSAHAHCNSCVHCQNTGDMASTVGSLGTGSSFLDGVPGAQAGQPRRD